MISAPSLIISWHLVLLGVFPSSCSRISMCAVKLPVGISQMTFIWAFSAMNLTIIVFTFIMLHKFWYVASSFVYLESLYFSILSWHNFLFSSELFCFYEFLTSLLFLPLFISNFIPLWSDRYYFNALVSVDNCFVSKFPISGMGCIFWTYWTKRSHRIFLHTLQTITNIISYTPQPDGNFLLLKISLMYMEK